MQPEQFRDAVLDHFREQTVWADAFGSPFSARLTEHMGRDYASGGPVAELLADWQGHPRADAVAVRLAGALHAAVLTGRDAALAAQYPQQRAAWEIDAVWPLARAFLAREHTWVAAFIRSPPQTNEVRRAIVLLLGFLSLARDHDCEFDMFELGASAGLNLNWDRFAYRTEGWSWGAREGVSIDTAWHAPPPPLDATVRVRSRAACDLNPLDIRDPAQRMRLRAYVWADQRARLQRFDAAAELALATDIQVERGDAAPWLKARLDARSPGGGAIVYHSVFMQYLTREAWRALEATVEDAGARATPAAPLAWVRLEPEAILGGPRTSTRLLLDLKTWPGPTHQVLAVTDGHATAVHPYG